MKLIELYEELFQYVCRLRRLAKAKRQPAFETVRADLVGLTGRIRAAAKSDVQLQNQVAELDLPVLFFVDNMVCSSGLAFSGTWNNNRLAKERNELAGDERFFDFVERDLRDPSEEAAQRLAIYYLCFGLGFTGMYAGNQEKIATYMERIFPRIQRWADADFRSKIASQAYEHTDPRVLTEPPSSRIILVVIAFVFFTLSTMVVYYFLYQKAVVELAESVDKITKEGERLSGREP